MKFTKKLIVSGIILAATASSTTSYAEQVIRLGHTGAANHHFQAISEQYAELVSERTDGEISIEVYPSDQLGNQTQLVEGTLLGTNDMVLTSDAVLSNFVPDVGIINLPFIFRDSDHVRTALDGEVGQDLSTMVEEQGAVVVGWWENGFRHITNSRNPIETPEDIEGMKLRVPEGPVFVSTFEALGANPTPISFGELYSALQLGVVDGQENPPAHILTQKFYEVQDYVSRTGHIYLSSPVLINKNLLESLSEEHQNVILETGRELAAVHTSMVLEEEDQQWEEIAGYGMEINDVDPAPFIEATASVIEQYRGKYNADIIDKITNM
tara:strand:- start:2852 stop:3826 length:975 start_codon:yes stop_codon:yes gene_type:complete